MHTEQDYNLDSDMIINDDKMLKDYIKQEIDSDIKMAHDKERIKPLNEVPVNIKNEGNMSVHKPKIKHMAPITPSLPSKSKSETMNDQKCSLLNNHTAPLEMSQDKIMTQEAPNHKSSKSLKIKNEARPKKKNHRSKSKQNKNKSIILEYNKLTHEFKVIISKNKSNPLHLTYLVSELSKSFKKLEIKEEFIDKTDKKRSIKNLKVKTKSKNPSKSRSKHLSKSKLKPSFVATPKVTTTKSTKRVLLKTTKTLTAADINSRLLRSGKKLPKSHPQKPSLVTKASPRTRSHNKNSKASTTKTPKTSSKITVISKLIESSK